ncbi:hypothetical protein RFI_27261 [Reticulomyxa filosa]|uniref:Uncharacterized protein n=1 Tax=Reticulomyxa filosa TaxID=46433 RepID=X6M8Y0_RETFI|nr:hypothetical protein RFI_27261 [Reticulomyxa filosa]|eukprot:ETO10116.1 hypothetical protein RFI_27261 [Reticulomyxa filosa]
MDWNPISNDDFMGQHQVTMNLKPRKDHIQETWLPLFDRQNDALTGTKGELLVSIEATNLWTAVNNIGEDKSFFALNANTHTPNNESPSSETNGKKKKKKGLFAISSHGN